VVATEATGPKTAGCRQDGDIGHPGGAIRDGDGEMRQYLPAVMAAAALFERGQGVGQPRGEAEHVPQITQEPRAHMRPDRVVPEGPVEAGPGCGIMHLSSALLRGANGVCCNPIIPRRVGICAF
jgi:hypothetical protein